MDSEVDRIDLYSGTPGSEVYVGWIHPDFKRDLAVQNFEGIEDLFPNFVERETEQLKRTAIPFTPDTKITATFTTSPPPDAAMRVRFSN